jgi:hypothetical protein
VEAGGEAHCLPMMEESTGTSASEDMILSSNRQSKQCNVEDLGGYDATWSWGYDFISSSTMISGGRYRDERHT